MRGFVNYFKLRVSDVAYVLSCPKSAVYEWLSNGRPPENHSRVEALSQIADTFKEADVTRADTLLKMNISGRTLLDIVKADEDWRGTVDLLITESRAMEFAYERSGLAKSKAKKTSDWLSEHSIPACRMN